MSTTDQPQTPPLTRRQLREIRDTGSTPVLTPENIAQHEAAMRELATPVQPDVASAEVPDADRAVDEAEPEAELVEVEAVVGEEPAVADERVAVAQLVEDDIPEPIESAPVSEPTEEHAPAASFADPGVVPLTRRQAREHERIRTASVPIITPDAAHTPTQDETASPVEAPLRDLAPVRRADDDSAPAVIAGIPGLTRPPLDVDEVRPTAIVNPNFGSGLLAGETPAVELPPSFDQLISRTGSTGVSTSTPHALILSQTPSVAPLVAPVTATGEVLITGTFDLPEGLGSVGHAPGIHDGKEADAVLVDGELPAASSPTPIAASAAISQVRTNDEIIRPPAPDTGNRLVLILGITAGVLGLGVIAIFTLVFTTGVL